VVPGLRLSDIPGVSRISIFDHDPVAELEKDAPVVKKRSAGSELLF